MVSVVKVPNRPPSPLVQGEIASPKPSLDLCYVWRALVQLPGDQDVPVIGS